MFGEDTWALMEDTESDSSEPRLYMKNVSARERAGTGDYPYAAHIRAHFGDTDEDGQASGPVAEAIDDLEHIDIAIMQRDGLAILVGVATRHDCREFLLYARDEAAFSAAMGRIQDATPETWIEHSVSVDTQWNEYDGFP